MEIEEEEIKKERNGHHDHAGYGATGLRDIITGRTEGNLLQIAGLGIYRG